MYSQFPKNFPLPFILDGATGTSLIRDGMPKGCCTEKWISDNPQVLVNIQKAYAAVGSDAVLTPTFGANASALKRHGVSGGIDSMNKNLAGLSTMSGAKFKGADMSPTGAFIYPYGDDKFDDVCSIYKEQAAALDSTDVDFFFIETNINLAEVRAAVTAVHEVSSKPIFVTMTVDSNGRTLAGDTLLASMLTLADIGINAFGTNCSVGPADMLEALKPLVPYSLALGIPLIAKPNAGMPKNDNTFDMNADEFSEYAVKFLENGIYILGGCCGTDCKYISGIRKAADNFVIKALKCEIPDLSNTACTNRIVGEPVEHIELTSIEEAENELEEAYFNTSPLSISGDTEAIEYFKRYYNGKIIISEV